MSVRQTRHCYQSVKKDELKSRTNIIFGALLLVSSLRSFSNRKTIIGISILLWIVYFLSNLCPFPPAVISQIEFKKRGLPHIHIIIWLVSEHKLQTPSAVDRIISAQLPDILCQLASMLFINSCSMAHVVRPILCHHA